MKFEIYDEKERETLIIFDCFILPFGLTVSNVLIKKDFLNIFQCSKSEQCILLQDFLENRCSNILNYEYDKWALRFLELEFNQSYFGRMNNSRILIGVLQRFRSNQDSYVIYPRRKS